MNAHLPVFPPLSFASAMNRVARRKGPCSVQPGSDSRIDRAIVETTAGYYSRNAQSYVEATQGLDLGFAWERFLSAVPPGGAILDAGCGSGRDSAYFQSKGYAVEAIDACPEMVAVAWSRGIRAELRLLQEIEKCGAYAGIWACASLLHVPEDEIGQVLGNFRQALVPGGVAYISLKEGSGEGVQGDGRFFSYFTEERFRALVAELPGLKVRAFERTQDVAKRDQVWLNFTLERSASWA